MHNETCLLDTVVAVGRQARRRLGLLAAVAIVATAGCRSAQSDEASRRLAVNGLVLAPAQRTTMARLTGTTLTGQRLDTVSWRGHVIVVNFWGSWCAPCRKEAPELARTARATAPYGVRFLGVDIRDKLSAARAFEARYGIPYPSLYDQPSRNALQFNGIVGRAVPFTIVLDAEGRVAARYLGATSYAPLRETIAQVVGPAMSR